jgi:hypothetical protein
VQCWHDGTACFSPFCFLQAPDCGDFSAVSDQCVKDTLAKVLPSWSPVYKAYNGDDDDDDDHDDNDGDDD